ncbi:MAG: SpoIIE family protein phosphatase, partial [Planctomycetota bacterium]
MRLVRAHVFSGASGAALYTAAAFGLLLHIGVPPIWACLAAAVTGLGIAALASALTRFPEEDSEEDPGGNAAPRGFARTRASAAVAASAGASAAGASAAGASAAGASAAGASFGGETRESRASREIQRALLPRDLPAIVGYHVDADYQPCGVLGGDFYDCLPCADGRVLFTLGDVSGKGPAGAIVMSMVQTLFRQNLARATGPADLLARVNEGFAGTLGKGIFVTTQVAILDPERHRLTLATAGHHGLLLLNPSLRKANEVSARGLALGIVAGPAFREGLRETTIDIAPGDSMLLFTDGAVESEAEVARGVGESRLLAAAAGALLAGPDGALQRLEQD